MAAQEIESGFFKIDCIMIQVKLTLLVGDVLHGETFHVENDGGLHNGVGIALVFVEIGVDSGDAGFHQVNDVHDVILLLCRA